MATSPILEPCKKHPVIETTPKQTNKHDAVLELVSYPVQPMPQHGQWTWTLNYVNRQWTLNYVNRQWILNNVNGQWTLNYVNGQGTLNNDDDVMKAINIKF